MSQGLGRDWAIDNGIQLRRNLGTTIRGANVGLPRYYVDLLGVPKEDLEERKEARIEALYVDLEKRFPRSDFELEEDWVDACYAWIQEQAGQREKNLVKLGQLKERIIA